MGKGAPIARGLAGLFVLLWLGGCAAAPARDTPEWWRRMRDRDILVTADDVPGTGLKITSAAGLTAVPADAVWEAFLDIDSMHTYLYRVIESRVLERGERRLVFKIVVNAPPIALTSGYNKISITAEMTETHSGDGRIRRGDFQSVEGNIRRAFGSWEVEELGEGETLVTFSMFIDFGRVVIPDQAANFFVKDFLYTWGGNFREHVEDPSVRLGLERAAAKRAGRDPNEVAPDLRGMEDFMR